MTEQVVVTQARPADDSPADDAPEVLALLRRIAQGQERIAQGQETTNELLQRLVGQEEDDFSKRAKPPEIWIESRAVLVGLHETYPVVSHDIAMKNPVLMDKSKAGMWRINQWGRAVTRHFIPNLPRSSEPTPADAVDLIGIGNKLRWGKKFPEEFHVYVARKDAWHHVREHALKTGILDEKAAAQTAETYGLTDAREACYYCARDRERAARETMEAAAREEAREEAERADDWAKPVNFERVTKVYREESGKKTLVSLEADFFDKLEAYVARLEESADAEAQKNPNSPKALLLQDELRKVRKRRDEILAARERKLAKDRPSVKSG